jgi:hypothetical protein
MQTTTHQRRLRTATALLVLLGAGCGDGPTGPQLGTIQVSVHTSGGIPNDDQYELVVGSELRQPIAPSGTAVVSAVSAGPQTVALALVSENCTVSGANPVSVIVQAGQTVQVEFEVVCVTTGIEVTTRTTGSHYPTTFHAAVDDQTPVAIGVNSSLIVSRLRPGTHTVELRLPGDNCSIVGNTSISVEVSNRTVAPVLFEIVCVPPIRLEKIAFVADNRIALVNPDGSGNVELVSGHSPAWSPDGTRLVFSTAVCDYYYGECTGGLVVIDPETRSFTSLSQGQGGSSPAWSPTGDAIAFADGLRQLYLVKLDGTPAVTLTVPGVRLASDPAWSPDGQRIAFTCFVALDHADVCVANSDGTGLVRLTIELSHQSDPAWSPDGSRIAFTTQGRIALMALDGSGATPLTEGFDPAWSPDGSTLLFARADGLFTIDVDGSNLTRLTTGGHYDPAWRP